MKTSDLTSAILKSVSRSFYLSLAVLPAAVRPAIGLAYLLARAADTIADTRLIDRHQRITHLRALRAELDAPERGRLEAIVQATRGVQSLRPSVRCSSGYPSAWRPTGRSTPTTAVRYAASSAPSSRA